jgi:hypothetical protein
VGTISTSPRLCQGKDLEPGTKYATLSHCWGDQGVVTLTKDTFGPFQGKIPMDVLPKTFQDAIIITRRLASRYGVRFLWIDSLCILQDSLEDWNEEAPRMVEVFGNCWCNIAATHAPDGRTGLFASRDPTKLLSIFLKTQDRNSYEPVEHLCVSSSRWADNIDNAPLNKRGWVTQERFLSPHILHFAAVEIFFECQRGRASETFFKGEPDSSPSDWQDENGHPLNNVTCTSVTETSVQHVINAWCWQVRRYSSGRLTKRTDKLIAMSGIAKVFRGFFEGSDYLAGLWKHDLVHQLAWSRKVGPFTSGTPHHEYIAPSWSWASVEGSCFPSWVVRFSYIFEKPQSLIEIIDAKVQPSSEDPFGRLSGGFLRLRCRLLKGRLTNHNSATNPLGHIKLDTVEPLEILDFSPDVNLRLRTQATELYCVPVTYNRTGSSSLATRALILEPTHVIKGQFRRVGATIILRMG